MAIFGLILGVSSVLITHLWHGGSLLMLLDGPAFIIVLGGTIGAVSLQTPTNIIYLSFVQLKWIIKPPNIDYVNQARKLQAWGGVARHQGLLILEKKIEDEADEFTRQGLIMLVDGVSIDDIRYQLETDIVVEQTRNEQAAKVFESMGGYSPTIGIIGAVLGLIQAMIYLKDPSALGASIAIAFIATIYGVGFANLIFIPVANRLRAIHYENMNFQYMTLEGLLAIAHGESGSQIERKLKTFTKGI